MFLKAIYVLLGIGGTPDFVLIPAQKPAIKIAGLATVTSSAEQAFGFNELIAVNATKDVTIKFGPAGLGAAAATDFRIPANQTQVFDLGRQWTSVRFFNLDAASADIYIQVVVKG